jgi:rare lipoprotein A
MKTPNEDDFTSSLSTRECTVRLERCLLLAAAAGLISSAYTTSSFARTIRTNNQNGLASVYSTESGSRTSSGQRLNPGALTAAHRSLPLGTKVRVTNQKNGHSVVVTINDRGPFVGGRVIDVTPAAARALGFSGVVPVNLKVER